MTYDNAYPRLKTRTDNTGIVNYVYNDVGKLGALRPAGEVSFVNSKMLFSSYGYDANGSREGVEIG